MYDLLSGSVGGGAFGGYRDGAEKQKDLKAVVEAIWGTGQRPSVESSADSSPGDAHLRLPTMADIEKVVAELKERLKKEEASGLTCLIKKIWSA